VASASGHARRLWRGRSSATGSPTRASAISPSELRMIHELASLTDPVVIRQCPRRCTWPNDPLLLRAKRSSQDRRSEMAAFTNDGHRRPPQWCGGPLLLWPTRAAEQQPGHRTPVGDRAELLCGLRGVSAFVPDRPCRATRSGLSRVLQVAQGGTVERDDNSCRNSSTRETWSGLEMSGAALLTVRRRAWRIGAWTCCPGGSPAVTLRRATARRSARAGGSAGGKVVGQRTESVSARSRGSSRRDGRATWTWPR
jgi:hypothetical protein